MIQKVWRAYTARAKLLDDIVRSYSATDVQRVWRGALARMDLRKKNEAAVKISSTFRCYQIGRAHV